jgi:phosphonate utilization transcriptional regulator
MRRTPNKRPVPASEASAAFELLRQKSLNSLVQREIERRILAGELTPGTKLNEAELAAEMGISRGPVREAFRALEQAGLLYTEKNRGVFVRQVSLEEADEIFEVRAALEAQIGRLAAARIVPEQLQRLRGVIKRMHAASRSRDADAYFPLNIEFHEALAEVAGNRALAANYRRVVNELNLYRRETLARNADIIPVSTQEHEAIVDAVAKGDAALAERLLYEHVMNSRARLHLALESAPAHRTKAAREAA